MYRFKRTTKAKTKEDTIKLRALVSALMNIPFDDYEQDSVERGDIRINDHNEVLETDKNKLRVRILLDMKKCMKLVPLLNDDSSLEFLTKQLGGLKKSPKNQLLFLT